MVDTYWTTIAQITQAGASAIAVLLSMGSLIYAQRAISIARESQRDNKNEAAINYASALLDDLSKVAEEIEHKLEKIGASNFSLRTDIIDVYVDNFSCKWPLFFSEELRWRCEIISKEYELLNSYFGEYSITNENAAKRVAEIARGECRFLRSGAIGGIGGRRGMAREAAMQTLKE